MMVVATDAPLNPLNLERLARRALMGLARTGSSGSNGSGDYVLAFSSSPEVRRTSSREPREILDLPNDAHVRPLPGRHRDHRRGHLQLPPESHRCYGPRAAAPPGPSRWRRFWRCCGISGHRGIGRGSTARRPSTGYSGWSSLHLPPESRGHRASGTAPCRRRG